MPKPRLTSAVREGLVNLLDLLPAELKKGPAKRAEKWILDIVAFKSTIQPKPEPRGKKRNERKRPKPLSARSLGVYKPFG